MAWSDTFLDALKDNESGVAYVPDNVVTIH